MLANASGVGVFGDVAETTTAGISDSIISCGAVGVYTQTSIAGAAVRVSVIRSTIEHTTSAAVVSNMGSGVILSLGNNHFTDNGSSEGVLTPTPPK